MVEFECECGEQHTIAYRIIRRCHCGRYMTLPKHIPSLDGPHYLERWFKGGFARVPSAEVAEARGAAMAWIESVGLKRDSGLWVFDFDMDYGALDMRTVALQWLMDRGVVKPVDSVPFTCQRWALV